MTHKNKIDNKTSLVNLFFLALALLCVTNIVICGHSYSFLLSSLSTICYIILLFIIVGFQTVYLHISGDRWWHTLSNGIVIIMFFIPTLFGISILQMLYQDNQLSKFGITTFGKVIGYESEYRRSGIKNYATIEYNFESETYIQKIENDNNAYAINDTVNIKISSKDPELFKLLGVRK